MVNQDEKNSHDQESSKAEQLEERKSEATSSETVSDLQETKEGSGSVIADPDPGLSPDGALDERAEVKDAGPM